MKTFVACVLLAALTTSVQADTVALVLNLKPRPGGQLDAATVHQAGGVLRQRLAGFVANWPGAHGPQLKMHAEQCVVSCAGLQDSRALQAVLTQVGQASLQINHGTTTTPRWAMTAAEHTPWFSSARYIGSHRMALMLTGGGHKTFQTVTAAALHQEIGLFVDGTLVQYATVDKPMGLAMTLQVDCPKTISDDQLRQLAAVMGGGVMPAQVSLVKATSKP